ADTPDTRSTTEPTSSPTVDPATATQLVITTQPASTITAGGTVSLGVTVEDQFGNPITTKNTGSTDTISVALSSQSFAAGTTSVVAANRAANFIRLQNITTAETRDLPTSSDTTHTGVTSAISNSITVNPAAVSKLVFTTGAVSGAAANKASLGPITVQEQDQFGNPTTTAETVNLSSNSTGTYIFNTTQNATTPTGASSVSITAGSSTATFYYGDTHADGPTITAAASGLTSATQTETITAAAANKLVYSQAPSAATEGLAFASPPLVQVQDQFGNLISSDNGRSITLSIDTGTGTLRCTSTSVTDTNGIASFDSCNVDEAGSGVKLGASAFGLTGATSSSFNISDASLTASGVAVTANEGSSFSGAVATFTDANPFF